MISCSCYRICNKLYQTSRRDTNKVKVHPMRNKISKREPTGNSLHVRPFENETRAWECSYVKIDFLLPNLISISRPRQPLNSSREIAFYRTLFTAYSPLDVTSQNSISKEGIFYHIPSWWPEWSLLHFGWKTFFPAFWWNF